MTEPWGPIAVMGVSGAGKSTVGERLAAALGAEYADGDAFHPPANVAKMAAGVPLDDADRWPWLDLVAAWLADHAEQPDGPRNSPRGVVACSALTRAYRDRLRAKVPALLFIELDVPRGELLRRLTTRSGHFMGAQLLGSQLATLQPLAPDEPGARIDATGDVDRVVERAIRATAGGWTPDTLCP
ncbi:gluconokinase [Nocardia wallacei]|uniref:gluconokinase n=1 Tax=Nocardia wallacei TaxID=480035 RepID=UPI002458967B|nr:gluconokinase [Nocardia wallacei]